MFNDGKYIHTMHQEVEIIKRRILKLKFDQEATEELDIVSGPNIVKVSEFTGVKIMVQRLIGSVVKLCK